MDHEARLAALLLRWEEAIAHGRHLAPSEICLDCPELLDEFQGLLRFLGRLRIDLSSKDVADPRFAANLRGSPDQTIPETFPS